nr:AAA family ATPase [uncultured Draconibacterium sp.]
MTPAINYNRLKTSWTKYDIVQVLEVIENLDVLDKYIKKEASIDEPILKSFLGIKTLKSEIPEYWKTIQNHPKEKKLFALFALIFTHIEVVRLFADKYSTNNLKGVFVIEPGKQFTNIRSALIEAGASPSFNRRKEVVPYDFTPIFHNMEVGKLFKNLLKDRIANLTKLELTDELFYEICSSNKFHKTISLTEKQFKLWLEGKSIFESTFINGIHISKFLSIENVNLNFSNSKEIYFLGENGDGKSLILMGIYLAFNGNYITEKTDQEKTGRASDIIRKNRDAELTGFDEYNKEFSPKRSGYLNNLFAYGTHRGRWSTDDHEEYGFMSLFDSNETLVNPVSWLKDLNTIELQRLNKQNPYEYSNKIISVESITQMFYELLEKNIKIQFIDADVKFIEKGALLSFDELSEGYRSIIIFVSDLIYRLSKLSPDNDKITQLKGIVLVDEIDLHLHPKWQRVIIQKLRKLFPNIQFIFTTHSPAMIQGASKDALIYKVYRNDNDGFTRVSEPFYRKNLDHLMINTLVTSPLFGMSDSRMNTDYEDADTSDTYLSYRINKILDEELEKQKASGKKFISDAEVDKLIKEILNEELGQDD